MAASDAASIRLLLAPGSARSGLPDPTLQALNMLVNTGQFALSRASPAFDTDRGPADPRQQESMTRVVHRLIHSAGPLA